MVRRPIRPRAMFRSDAPASWCFRARWSIRDLPVQDGVERWRRGAPVNVDRSSGQERQGRRRESRRASTGYEI